MKINYQKLYNKTWKKICILLLIALTIRLVCLPFNTIINTDGVSYATIGSNLIQGNGYTHITGKIALIIAPFYPFLLGLVSLFVSNIEVAGQVVSMLFGVLLIIPIYFLARKLYNERIAILTSILVILSHSLIFVSTEVKTEAIYIFLLISAIYLSWLALTKKKIQYYILSAAFFALCFMTRQEAIGYIVIFLILNALCIWKYVNRKKVITFLSSTFLIVIVFLVVSSPWLIFRYQVTGDKDILYSAEMSNLLSPTVISLSGFDLSKTEEYEDFWMGLDEHNQIKAEKYWYSEYKDTSFFNSLKSNPKTVMLKWTEGFYISCILFIPQIFNPLFIGLAFIGLLTAVYTKSKLKRELFLIAFMLFSFSLYPLAPISPRYYIPILPILFLFVAKGMILIYQPLQKTISNITHIKLPYHKIEALSILVIAIISAPLIYAQFAYSFEPIEYKDAGLWLKDNTPQNSIVMSRKPEIAFYADRTWRVLPYANYSSTMAYARQEGVNYLVFDERLSKLRPQLTFLLDEDKTPDDLKLVHVQNCYKVMVYELR